MKNTMIKTLACCAFLCSTPVTGFGQTNILHGRLRDAGSGEALGYVSIGIPGSSTGTVSKPDGSFELLIPAEAPDSVAFSCIGYARQVMAIRDAQALASSGIGLYPAPLALREVVISPSKETKTRVFGMEKTGTVMSVNFALNNRINQNLGSEVGRLFKIRDAAQLEEFRFFVAGNNFDTVQFRINVYLADDKQPGDNLLKDNIIVTLANRKSGWVEVDLRPWDIRTDQPVVVSVEWVYAAGKGSYLALPIGMPRPGNKHYYKYGSQNRWKVFNMMSAAMTLQIRQ
jgi:hypothetical protein